jgi:hypothetical protein
VDSLEGSGIRAFSASAEAPHRPLGLSRRGLSRGVRHDDDGRRFPDDCPALRLGSPGVSGPNAAPFCLLISVRSAAVVRAVIGGGPLGGRGRRRPGRGPRRCGSLPGLTFRLWPRPGGSVGIPQGFPSLLRPVIPGLRRRHDGSPWFFPARCGPAGPGDRGRPTGPVPVSLPWQHGSDRRSTSRITCRESWMGRSDRSALRQDGSRSSEGAGRSSTPAGATHLRPIRDPTVGCQRESRL